MENSMELEIRKVHAHIVAMTKIIADFQDEQDRKAVIGCGEALAMTVYECLKQLQDFTQRRIEKENKPISVRLIEMGLYPSQIDLTKNAPSD